MNKEELDELIAKLKLAQDKYNNRSGSYTGQYAEFNQNKVTGSLNCITSLLAHFNRYSDLTAPQVELAKKMIRNANALR